ncbi:hypothetical protein pf16_236 [Pseudomonas phage pf16]|uniref:Uncharacterized protein n=1 Tax=Pseudomonas phage pf16 TaxID=1815630 RepID=A0A1S5R425_9CAUD|nr:hypothetical protein FDG98_gp062 [Pseudomonas phage pf16]AND75159.1 hypothetical protein pf16_236 [Pseudomonas phage pf16]
MTAPINKPVSEAVKDRFRAYYAANPSWGWLHIVLEDQNIHDGHVIHCQNRAAQHGDQEAYELADELLKMSKSQRIKLSREIH